MYILKSALVGLSIGVVEAPPEILICGYGLEWEDAHWRSTLLSLILRRFHQ